NMKRGFRGRNLRQRARWQERTGKREKGAARQDHRPEPSAFPARRAGNRLGERALWLMMDVVEAATFDGVFAMKSLIPLALMALVGGSSAAMATDVAPPKSCFLITQFENWKAPDDKTIFIRVNLNRFYRLDVT